MEVTYRMDTQEAQTAFERDYRHLFYRLVQLRDYIRCYYTYGNPHGLVSGKFDASGIPYIESVTFESADALRYQTEMEQYLSRPMRKMGPLPLPRFGVRVIVNFCDGNTREFSYPFHEYSDEMLVKFCEKIKRTQTELWRESLRKKKGPY